MSASDAKESIGKGSSLKERMAALQGRGGFGAPPPVAPKPAVERPKWKPPPVVSPPVEDEPEATGEEESSGSPSIPARSAESPVVKPEGEDEVESDKATDIPEKKASEEEEGTEEVDAEAEERQRRAAIAARMARLGGARLGMGAPVFGAPGHKKPDTPKEEKSEAPLEEAAPAESTSAPDGKFLAIRARLKTNRALDTSLEPPAAEGVPAEQVAVKSDAETQSGKDIVITPVHLNSHPVLLQRNPRNQEESRRSLPTLYRFLASTSASHARIDASASWPAKGCSTQEKARQASNIHTFDRRDRERKRK